MNFELTRENAMIKQAIRDWVSKECSRDVISTLDETDAFPEQLVRKLAELGFGGMMIPETYGGEGQNSLGACLVAEEIAYAYPALSACYVAAAFLGGAVISELGSDLQRQTYLPVIAETSPLVAVALSEQDDADAEYTETSAEKKGQSYVINGCKSFVKLGDRAELILLLTRTAADPEGDGLTLFCLDAGTAGLKVTAEEAMGFKGAHFCKLELSDVVLPADHILGGPDRAAWGKSQLERVQDWVMLAYAAIAVGIARGAFQSALRHARQRKQFGREIGRFPAIRHMLSTLAYQIEAARLMVYKAAWGGDQGRNGSHYVAMARSIGAEAAVRSAMEGLQVLGGYGYTMEYDMQRYVRDSIALLSFGKSLGRLKEQIGASLLKF